MFTAQRNSLAFFKQLFRKKHEDTVCTLNTTIITILKWHIQLPYKPFYNLKLLKITLHFNLQLLSFSKYG